MEEGNLNRDNWKREENRSSRRLSGRLQEQAAYGRAITQHGHHQSAGTFRDVVTLYHYRPATSSGGTLSLGFRLPP